MYERTHEFLDEDERMITRSIYDESSWMYDSVRGTVSLFRHVYNDEVDWVFNNRLHTINKDENWRFLGEFIIVRLVDWVNHTEVAIPDYISREELEANRDRYVILDICLKVASKYPPYSTRILKDVPPDFSIDGYDRMDVMYRVRNRAFEDI